MRKQTLILVLAFLALCFTAQGQEASTSAQQSEPAPAEQPTKARKSASDIFTGFSGGMMIHAGYLFSDDPTKIFSNTGLGSEEYRKALPKDGACFGLGGTLRIHLINHIHLGAEGSVSTMPLRGAGNVRSGWGGAICDFYTDWGKVRPIIGMGVGGGVMKRLFVPDEAQTVFSNDSALVYNASYVKTPFFYMDPYVGLEIGLKSHMALIIRIDYMLPFGTASSKLTENVNWSNFMTPSGPRLYIGIMFGKLKRD